MIPLARSTFRIDRKGVREILNRAETAAVVREMAEEIADNVRQIVGDDVEVVVESYQTDRSAAAVTIADARGMEYQATNGALTRAAAAVGLEVRSR